MARRSKDKAAKEAYHGLDTATYFRIYGDEYDDHGDPIKPPKTSWWKHTLFALFYATLAGILISSCYLLVTKTSFCQGWVPVPESEVRAHAEKLGKRVLCCDDVKVYITGRGGYNRAYVAVVGCDKKVMLQCYSRSDGPDHSGCRLFSDVMPGNVLNVKHRSCGSGKFYTEWWELEF